MMLRLGAYLTALASTLLGISSPAQAIISGTEAAPLTFPFAVSVQSGSIFGQSHICGGTNVGTRTVLTAAHCCQGSTPTSLFVRYGSHKLASSDGRTVPVSGITIHPYWNSNTLDSNFCLLDVPGIKLGLISTTPALLPLLPLGNIAGVPARVAGWGRKAANGPASGTLQEATVQVISNADCNTKWAGKEQHISTKNICAQPLSGGNQLVSACNGDHGGPLVDITGLTLLGVVSYTENNCTSVPVPNVYGDVYEVVEWIRANLK